MVSALERLELWGKREIPLSTMGVTGTVVDSVCVLWVKEGAGQWDKLQRAGDP